jgi:hypothetical protein
MSAFGGKADMTVRGNPGALRWPDYRNKDWPDAIKIVHHKTGATLWHPLQEEADARGGHWSVLTLEPMHASVDELFLNLVKIGPHVKVLVGTIQRASAATCSVRGLTFMN